MRKIKLTNTTKYTQVDDEDYPVLVRLNWYLSDTGYAIADTPVKHLKMHKLLTGAIPPKTVVDHIDRDKLNNQKDNLRIISQSANARNSYRYENSKNYYLNKKRNTWVVEVKELGVRYLPVKNPTIAERAVKRLKLGFPKEVAKLEAEKPTISITNWSRRNITYGEYMKAKKLGISVKELRKFKEK